MNLIFYIENKQELKKITFENLLNTIYKFNKDKLIHKITFVSLYNISKELVDVVEILQKDFRIKTRFFVDFENFKNKFEKISKSYPDELYIDKQRRFFYAVMEQENPDMVFFLSNLVSHIKFQTMLKNKNIKIFKLTTKIQ